MTNMAKVYFDFYILKISCEILLVYSANLVILKLVLEVGGKYILIEDNSFQCLVFSKENRC